MPGGLQINTGLPRQCLRANHLRIMVYNSNLHDLILSSLEDVRWFHFALLVL